MVIGDWTGIVTNRAAIEFRDIFDTKKEGFKADIALHYRLPTHDLLLYPPFWVQF